MAKTKVTYSEDATTIIFKGNPKNPECSTAIIKFPGGHVEVSRTSDNKYWAHLSINEDAEIISSRMDFGPNINPSYNNVHEIPEHEHITKMALKINGPFVEVGAEHAYF